MDSEIAVATDGCYVQGAKLESAGAFEDSGPSIEYHHIGLIDVYAEFPFVCKGVQAVQLRLQTGCVQG